MGQGSGAHHRLGLTAEVVGRNRVRWSAAQLSNCFLLLSVQCVCCLGLHCSRVCSLFSHLLEYIPLLLVEHNCYTLL